MIYAMRRHNARHTLVEAKSPNELELFRRVDPGITYERVSPSYARQWVRNGREHETGLYVDGDRIRYAKAEA